MATGRDGAMRWDSVRPGWEIDCRYLGLRRDSAWYLLARRHWHRWLLRMIRRMR